MPAYILDLEVPEETLATCSSCHNCVNTNNPKYHVKCCNYHPVQPNFVIGALLSSNDEPLASAQKIIRKKIIQKEGVSPIGIIPPSDFYLNKNNVVCPYLKDQLCSIWQYRTELCSTFFCSSIGGRSGQQFWNVLLDYLKLVDKQLSLYALQEIGFEANLIHYQYFSNSFASKKKELVKGSAKIFEKHWGEWIGQEQVLFIKCYEEILKTDHKIIERLIGWEGSWFSDLLTNKSKVFKESVLHDKLKLMPIDFVKDSSNDKCMLITSARENTTCNEIQMMFLKMFDGEASTKDIIRKTKELNQDITTIVYDLIQEGLLVPST